MVGDVSGKGVAAALFMARTKTLLETVAAREGDPAAILGELNRGLSAENDGGMYVTAVLGALHVETGELSLAVAGHEPPMLLPREGLPAAAQAEGGPVVGLLDAATYPLNALKLAPGEAVVLTTDGVSEARNAGDEFFDAKRLVATLAPLGREPVGAINDGILAAVRAFAGGAPQSDDITILTLRYVARA
jgi:sigma-B regulation protein RsbU (phosphoserine phosphatase)